MPYLTDQLSANGRLPPSQAQRVGRYLFDPEQVLEQLRQRIIGQDAVLHAMADMLHVVKAEMIDAHKPLSVSLFLGPTGVGKTETVKVIAEAISGPGAGFCRIDMNTLAQEHYASALVGAPPGYVGSKEGYTLLDANVIQGSFSKPGVVLFDEIEKASKEVVRTLLNILDTGKLKLPSANKEIDFCNAMIFMTSNIGSGSLLSAADEAGSRLVHRLQSRRSVKLIERQLQRHFDPEFLNRIERQLFFQPIKSDWLPQLVDLEITRLNQRLARRHIALTVLPAVKQYLCSCYDKRYGARGLARALKLELEPPVARAILTHPSSSSFTADISAQGILVAPI